MRLLANLGAALSARHRARSAPADLDEAVGVLQEAASLVAADDPARSTILANLGLPLRQRAQRPGRAGAADDLRAGARAYAESGAVASASALVRTSSMYNAGEMRSEPGDWPAAVDLLHGAIDLLAAVVDLRLDRDDQQRHLLQSSWPVWAAPPRQSPWPAGSSRRPRSSWLRPGAACYWHRR
ncbi:hypothetical protein [Solwaraspora sp. WMMA2065]|uniref:hypothetical protein n=1 Tax=Solwaraspora sp. WMMA2065 TaxID=3015166 RepID=UPI00259BEA7C|nr:hypothetical protein [Solwaraspora sp. WMMA2065]WJK33081.1 hypothetical protein O7610_20475 [Solwaraspora sp. WMMA2065]